jgi:steroid Delta-isomerase
VIDLVARHVALFNQGVRSGDFTAWFNTFAPDATLTFEGLPIPPAHGREAIIAVYSGHPPSSEMRLTAGSPADKFADTAFGDFVWEAAPTTGGRFTMHLADGMLTRLVVQLNAPPPPPKRPPA